MVVIRLSRTGAKKRPFYHIVVTDSRRRRDSNYIESIGYFNPVARGQEVRLHLDTTKLVEWQGVGAQLSDRVAALYKEHAKKAAETKAA
jgi:small subunit ribosomal protein S16